MKKILICILMSLSIVMLCACSGSVTDHLEEALKYIEAGERDKAIDELNKAIEADPNNAELYVKRAYSALMIDEKGLYEIDFERVLADLQKALQLDPENEEAMQLMYYAKVMMNQYDDAAKTLEELIGNIDVSDETKQLLEKAREGNVQDLSGKTRVQTNYLNGELRFKTYFDCGKDGRYSKIRSYDANNNLIGEVDVDYDEKGNRLTWAEFMENGEMYRTEFVYGDKDRIREYTAYKMDGSINYIVSYEYDEEGNAVNIKYDYGSYIQEHRNTYEDGGIVSSYVYENGDLAYYYLYIRDENDRIVRMESYNEKDELTYYMEHYYDEQGKETGYARYNKDGELIFERKDD